MDTDSRVIYAGSFSKALSPQFRLGYLVLPRELRRVFGEAKRLTDRHSARWEQNVLAALIEEGAYERHVRRLRRENEKRRKALLMAVEEQLAGRGQLIGTAAGLHGVLMLPALSAGTNRRCRRPRWRVGLASIHCRRCLPNLRARTRRRPAGLILGYAGLTVPEIHEGVGILAAVIRQCLALPPTR